MERYYYNEMKEAIAENNTEKIIELIAKDPVLQSMAPISEIKPDEIPPPA